MSKKLHEFCKLIQANLDDMKTQRCMSPRKSIINDPAMGQVEVLSLSPKAETIVKADNARNRRIKQILREGF